MPGVVVAFKALGFTDVRHYDGCGWAWEARN